METKPPSRILRFPELLERVGFARSTVLLRIKAGTFPKPRSLGDRAIGWLESDIERWMRNLPEAAPDRGGVACRTASKDAA